jgi:hypothetical protein
VSKVTGGQEAANELFKLARKSPRAMERSLFKYGNTRLTESKRLVPVEYGDLKDSGTADEPEWNGSNLSMELGYGGAAMEYAEIVHEDMEAFHDDGQAKYLEQPLNAAEPNFDQEIGADFERFMGLDK